jgi:hypothetical protein
VEKRRKVHMRARAASSAWKSSGSLLTTAQKRAFLMKQRAASAEKERGDAVVDKEGARKGEGRDDRIGAWIKDMVFPGYGMEAKKQNGRRVGRQRRCDARAPGPGVETVLRAQGRTFVPVRRDRVHHTE